MSVLINADTSDGLKFTSDTSGEIKLQSAGADKITMTSDGNLGIGTTTPSYTAAGRTIWTLNGSTDSVWTMNYGGTVGMYAQASATDGKLYTTGSLPLLFGTGSTERMRIDSNGNVLVATTNAAENAGPGIKLSYSTTDPTVRVVANSATSGNSGYILYNTNATNNGYRFYVTYSGVINAVTTSISAISDQRFKENIRDLDDGLDVVMSLKPRKFDWKEGKGANIKNARGFIAQEFEQVFPDLIDEWKDPAPEGEEPYKSVRQDLIPVLVKAIQEQQETIKALETRIQALENA